MLRNSLVDIKVKLSNLVNMAEDDKIVKILETGSIKDCAEALLAFNKKVNQIFMVEISIHFEKDGQYTLVFFCLE